MTVKKGDIIRVRMDTQFCGMIETDVKITDLFQESTTSEVIIKAEVVK